MNTGWLSSCTCIAASICLSTVRQNWQACCYAWVKSSLLLAAQFNLRSFDKIALHFNVSRQCQNHCQSSGRPPLQCILKGLPHLEGICSVLKRLLHLAWTKVSQVTCDNSSS